MLELYGFILRWEIDKNCILVDYTAWNDKADDFDMIKIRKWEVEVKTAKQFYLTKCSPSNIFRWQGSNGTEQRFKDVKDK